MHSYLGAVCLVTAMAISIFSVPTTAASHGSNYSNDSITVEMRIQRLVAICAGSDSQRKALTISDLIDAFFDGSNTTGDILSANGAVLDGELSYITWAANATSLPITLTGVLTKHGSTSAVAVEIFEGIFVNAALETYISTATHTTTVTLPIGVNGAPASVNASSLAQGVLAAVSTAFSQPIVAAVGKGASRHLALLAALEDIASFSRLGDATVDVSGHVTGSSTMRVPLASAANALSQLVAAPDEFLIPATAPHFRVIVAPMQPHWNTTSVDTIAPAFEGLSLVKPLYIVSSAASVANCPPFIGRRAPLPMSAGLTVVAKLPLDSIDVTRNIAFSIEQATSPLYADVVIPALPGDRAVVMFTPEQQHLSVGTGSIMLNPTAVFIDATGNGSLSFSLRADLSFSAYNMPTAKFQIEGRPELSSSNESLLSITGNLAFDSWIIAIGPSGLSLCADSVRPTFSGLLSGGSITGTIDGGVQLGDTSAPFSIEVTSTVDGAACVAANIASANNVTSMDVLAASFDSTSSAFGTDIPAQFAPAITERRVIIAQGTAYVNCGRLSLVASMAGLPPAYGGSANVTVNVYEFTTAIDWLNAVGQSSFFQGTLKSRQALRVFGRAAMKLSAGLSAVMLTPALIPFGFAVDLHATLTALAASISSMQHFELHSKAVALAASVVSLSASDSSAVQSYAGTIAMSSRKISLVAAFDPASTWTVTLADGLTLSPSVSSRPQYIASTLPQIQCSNWLCARGLNFVVSLNMSTFPSRSSMYVLSQFASQTSASVHAALSTPSPMFEIRFPSSSFPVPSIRASNIVAKVASNGSTTMGCILEVSIRGYGSVMRFAVDGLVGTAAVALGGALAEPYVLQVGNVGLTLIPGASSINITWNSFGGQIDAAAITARPTAAGRSIGVTLSMPFINEIYGGSAIVPFSVEATPNARVSVLDVLNALGGDNFGGLGTAVAPVFRALSARIDTIAGQIRPSAISTPLNGSATHPLSFVLSGYASGAGNASVAIDTRAVVPVVGVLSKLNEYCASVSSAVATVTLSNNGITSTVSVCVVLDALAVTFEGLPSPSTIFADAGTPVTYASPLCSYADAFVSIVPAIGSALPSSAAVRIDGLGWIPVWTVLRALSPVLESSRMFAARPHQDAPWSQWQVTAIAKHPAWTLADIFPLMTRVSSLNVSAASSPVVLVTNIAGRPPGADASLPVPSARGAWVVSASVSADDVVRSVFTNATRSYVGSAKNIAFIAPASAWATQFSLSSAPTQSSTTFLAEGIRVGNWVLDVPLSLTTGQMSLTGEIELLVGSAGAALSLPIASVPITAGGMQQTFITVGARDSVGVARTLPIGDDGIPLAEVHVALSWSLGEASSSVALSGSLTLSLQGQPLSVQLALASDGTITATGNGFPSMHSPCGTCSSNTICVSTSVQTGTYDCVPLDPCAIDNGGCGSPYASQCNVTNGTVTCTPLSVCSTIPDYCGELPALKSTCSATPGSVPNCYEGLLEITFTLAVAQTVTGCDGWNGMNGTSLAAWLETYVTSFLVAEGFQPGTIPADSNWTPVTSYFGACDATLIFDSSLLALLPLGELIFGDEVQQNQWAGFVAPAAEIAAISQITVVSVGGANPCESLSPSQCPGGTYCRPTPKYGNGVTIECAPVPRSCAFNNGGCGDPREYACVDGVLAPLQCVPQVPHVTLGSIAAVVFTKGVAAFGAAPEGLLDDIVGLPVDHRTATTTIDFVNATLSIDGTLRSSSANAHTVRVLIAPMMRCGGRGNVTCGPTGQQWTAVYQVAANPDPQSPFARAIAVLNISGAKVVLASGPAKLSSDFPGFSVPRGLSVVGNMSLTGTSVEIEAVSQLTGLLSLPAVAHMRSLSNYSVTAYLLGPAGVSIATNATFAVRTLTFKVEHDTMSGFSIDGSISARLGHSRNDVLQALPASIRIHNDGSVRLLSDDFEWHSPFGTPSVRLMAAQFSAAASSVGSGWIVAINATATMSRDISAPAFVSCAAVASASPLACTIAFAVHSATLEELASLLCPSIIGQESNGNSFGRIARHTFFYDVDFTIVDGAESQGLVSGIVGNATFFGQSTLLAQFSAVPPHRFEVALLYSSMSFMSGYFTVTGPNQSALNITIILSNSTAVAMAPVKIANMTLGSEFVNESPVGTLSFSDAGVQIDLDAAPNGLWMPVTLQSLSSKTSPFVITDFSLNGIVLPDVFNATFYGNGIAASALESLIGGLVNQCASASAQVGSNNATYMQLYSSLAGQMATDINNLQQYASQVPNVTSIYSAGINAVTTSQRLATVSVYGAYPSYSAQTIGTPSLQDIATGSSTVPFATSQLAIVSVAQQLSNSSIQALTSLAGQISTLNGIVGGQTAQMGGQQIASGIFSSAALAWASQMGTALAMMDYYGGIAQGAGNMLPSLVALYQLTTGSLSVQRVATGNVTKTVDVNRKRYYGGEAASTFDCSVVPTGPAANLTDPTHAFFDATAHAECVATTWGKISKGSKAVTPDQRPDIASRVNASCAKTTTAARIKNMCAGGVMKVPVNETVAQGSWNVQWNAAQLPQSWTSQTQLQLQSSAQYAIGPNSNEFVSFRPVRAHVLGTVSALSAMTLPRMFLTATVAGSSAAIPFFVDVTSADASQYAFVASLATALQAQNTANIAASS